MLAPIAIMYGVRKFVDTTNPEMLTPLRLFFAAGQIFTLFLWATTFFLIRKKNDQTKFKVSAADFVPPNPMAEMMGVKPPENESKEAEEITFMAYDLRMLTAAVKQLVVQTCIIVFIHWKWQVTLPLVMSVCMGVLNLTSQPLLKIYLLGMSTESHEDLKRPFKPPKSALQKYAEEQKKAVTVETAAEPDIANTKVITDKKKVTPLKKRTKARKD